jgi:hypothetical protein
MKIAKASEQDIDMAMKLSNALDSLHQLRSKGALMGETFLRFSGDMVRPILAGRKTQVRVILKYQPDAVVFGEPYWNIGGYRAYGFRGITDPLRMGTHNPLACPYGKADSKIWVRETWRPFEDEELGTCVQYRADDGLFKPSLWSNDQGAWCEAHAEYKDWRPSTNMPRWASRMLLNVKSIGVERLHDIDETGALAEGIMAWHGGKDPVYMLGPGDGVGIFGKPGSWQPKDTAVKAYRALWESSHGKKSWQANPWVWRIEFERENLSEKGSAS